MKHKGKQGLDSTTTTKAKRTRNNDLQLNSWNVRTLAGPGELSALILELRHYRCNITAIQETKLKGNNSFVTRNGYSVFLSNGERGRVHGVGFIVDKRWSDKVIDWTPINDRLCVLRVRTKFFNLSVINCYAPHNEHADNEKEAFYDCLERAYKKCPRHDIKIVIGDLNARVGREEAFVPIIGRHSLHRESNDNGLRLINFATAHNMRVSSTFFNHKNIHKATWTHGGSGTKAQLDHVLVDARHASDVLDVRSYRLLATDIDHHSSDHYLIGAKLRARVSNVNKVKGERCRRYDVAKLQNTEMRKRFSEKLNERLSDLNSDPTEWTAVCEILQETAENVLGFHETIRNEWFDDECRQACQAVIEARKKRQSGARRERVRELQREKRKLIRKKQRQYNQQLVADVARLHNINDVRNFYRSVSRAKKGFFARAQMCRNHTGELVCDTAGVLNCFRDHFDNLLNSEVHENVESRDEVSLESSDGVDVEPPSREEVASAIKRLKNHKAPGNDSLSAELFKAGSEHLVDALHSVIERFWSEEILPANWNIGIICPIFKKGDPLSCENFRGISLIPVAYKTLSIILADRLKPYAMNFVQPYQAGFTEGRSTTDQIFCLRQIIQKAHEMNMEVLNLFIDFKQAYDSIIREVLWKEMARFRFPVKLIRLLRGTLQGVRCQVKIGGELSQPFDSLTGLKQGDGLSTTLFNIALECVVRRSGIETSGSIFNKSVQVLGYADDLDIVARNLRALTDAFSRLEREAVKFGLRINTGKTKILLVRSSERTRRLVAENFPQFEVVDEFVYLGGRVDSSSRTSPDIDRRVTSARRAFFGIRHLLASKKISRNAKFQMYKTLIRPVAIYGSETWNLTAKDEEKLAVFERQVLRTIIGPIQEAGVYRRRYNHELYAIFRDVDIVRTVKLRRLEWAGHVVRREDNHPLQRAFRGSFEEGKRKRGRPQNTWKQGVESDCESFGLRNWQRSALDRTSFKNFLRETKDRLRSE
jgi:exonuclease III